MSAKKIRQSIKAKTRSTAQLSLDEILYELATSLRNGTIDPRSARRLLGRIARDAPPRRPRRALPPPPPGSYSSISAPIHERVADWRRRRARWAAIRAASRGRPLPQDRPNAS